MKSLLLEGRVLTHCDSDLKLALACESLSYGLGALLSHKMMGGSERPIAYTPRTLTKTERQYAKMEKEALGLSWGTRKLQGYLEGRHFKLVTNHKPLHYVMASGKAVPSTAAGRLQRWCVFLGAFAYNIEHRGTRQHCNYDSLSRLPVRESHPEESDEETLLYADIV